MTELNVIKNYCESITKIDGKFIYAGFLLKRGC